MRVFDKLSSSDSPEPLFSGRTQPQEFDLVLQLIQRGKPGGIAVHPCHCSGRHKTGRIRIDFSELPRKLLDTLEIVFLMIPFRQIEARKRDDLSVKISPATCLLALFGGQCRLSLFLVVIEDKRRVLA